MGGGEVYEGTNGVKPMNVAGRVVRERERLNGMTAEDRAWRKKWLADQTLTPQEPRFVLKDRKDLLNPIRRFYKFPLDFVFGKFVAPVTGKIAADVFRFYTGRIIMGAYGILGIVYYFKYNTNTWEGKGRWRVIESKSSVYPGEPGYPVVAPEKAAHEYHDREFKNSIFAGKFPQYQNQK
ncbi:NADH dehydrogenase [ubiquinone] 1 beta subcomplex subunit 6 [Orchesella cincta]|uniref:NADH dehydrogenase [ubiquinone] 1 beta subcomplex subunit 6 n=1 Tax=Orchesella cincta TaxID=48709 RepID=A0A1D2MW98_ORCCI|nr:NADH dehydrogenase [ubiquinone] 1 beta subcomplex subunit 6 [Orchesella cincta]